MLDSDKFDFFSSRLYCIHVTDNPMLNVELWHSLSAFETHVYGVALQYNRIRSDLVVTQYGDAPTTWTHNAGLDTYYYVLTWDKLSKICGKIQGILSRVQQSSPAVPAAFWQEFRLLRKRAGQLFSEFGVTARNEYEHPSLESYAVGNIIMWGSMMIDGSGGITAHVDANTFATVKLEHCKRLQDLRTDLIDLFLKHFSKRPLTKELVRVRNHIEENIESIAAELKLLKDNGDTAGFDDLLHRFVMFDVYFGREGVALGASVRDRFYAVIADSTSTTT